MHVGTNVSHDVHVVTPQNSTKCGDLEMFMYVNDILSQSINWNYGKYNLMIKSDH